MWFYVCLTCALQQSKANGAFIVWKCKCHGYSFLWAHQCVGGWGWTCTIWVISCWLECAKGVTTMPLYTVVILTHSKLLFERNNENVGRRAFQCICGSQATKILIILVKSIQLSSWWSRSLHPTHRHMMVAAICNIHFEAVQIDILLMGVGRKTRWVLCMKVLIETLSSAHKTQFNVWQ